MKKNILFGVVACGAMLLSANVANAQETIILEESALDCGDKYYCGDTDNWFIQLGGGINVPFVENTLPNGEEKHHITAAYNLGFGKWFSPYLGWRMSFLGGALHWDNNYYTKSKYVSANFDLMWDMFNSLGGVNEDRLFSIVPFAGLGGTFAWDFTHSMITRQNSSYAKRNSWTLPVSAGLQFRFRLSNTIDFFAEGRAQFYGDNFNNCAYGYPVDINLTAIGGFTFKLGGKSFTKYNPCDYVNYINNLNNQINDLRGELATCGAALAAAEAQLPCPEVKCPECPEVNDTPLMSVVRFTLNSSKVTSTEKVNVYNIAKWMEANPDAKVVIKGYADKKTGTSSYNMQLSEKRAKAVYNILTKEYGIVADRLSVKAEGSDTQIYETNNWNRIVVFSQN